MKVDYFGKNSNEKIITLSSNNIYKPINIPYDAKNVKKTTNSNDVAD